MKPDDELLALWVEDELDATAAPEVEAWVAGQPEWHERREQARWSKSLLGSAFSDDAEVPHAEFFNARIRREIEVTEVRSAAPPRERTIPWMWLMPATAAACMVFGFMLGRGGGSSEVTAPIATMAPVLYTPEKGVEAEYVNDDEATVIVLAGVDAIPDSWEIPETAMIEPEPSRMADASPKR